MRFFLFALLILTSSAQAQFPGNGLTMGNQCPYPYGPAGQAINGRDEISNLQGQLRQTQMRLQQRKQRLDRINQQLARARSDMQRALGTGAIRAIEEHRIHGRHRDSYQTSCGVRTGSAGSPGSNLVLPGESGGPSRGDNSLPPPPSEFCPRAGDGQRNTWKEFADDDGRVSESVCDYRIPGFQGRPPTDASARCREGLAEYYERIEDKLRLEREIADLDARLRHYERRLERIGDEIAEGTYCPNCQAQRRGYSSMSNTESIIGLVGIVAMAGFALSQSGNRGGHPHPHMMGRPGMHGPPPMAYGGGFPGQPYAARVPGYMGVGPGGVYGAVPGGVGPGAFGCQGTNPMMAANPMMGLNPMMGMGGLPQMLPMPGAQPNIFGQPNLFGNPFGGAWNPGMQNPLLNPGFGPGFMPFLGNGINGYNPYDPFNTAMNPYMQNPMFGQNPFMQQNPYAPGMLPYMNNPYGNQFMNPYGQNPFMQHPYLNNPYQSNPYFNNPYGNIYNNPYAPGMLPFPGPNPYGNMYNSPYGIPYGQLAGNPLAFANYPNLPFNNPYGAPYGSPVSNFYTQIDQLKHQIQLIQAGSGWNPNAPAVLPFPGPAYQQRPPIYNYPGGPLNPMPPPMGGPRPPPLGQPPIGGPRPPPVGSPPPPPPGGPRPPTPPPGAQPGPIRVRSTN